MKILHTISSIDLSNGGPSKSVCDLALNQVLQGQNVLILTGYSSKPYWKKSPHKNLELIFVKNFYYLQKLNYLLQNEKVNLIHGHSLWLLQLHLMAFLARKYKIPYIITPRGTLHPWSLKVKKWKKAIALFLYQKKDLKKANCIQATSYIEAEYFRKLNLNNPIAIIPNGISIEEFSNFHTKELRKSKTILFLSRIHYQKGLAILIEAWSQLDQSLKKNWKIEIVGNGEKGYVSSLQKIISDKGLSNEISISGPLYGKDKIAAYQRADLFVLPTYSENFGIVVAEAMALGVPVITTKGTPWEELITHNAGWWIKIGVQPLAEALEKALRLTDFERKKMGLNGRELIIEKYSIVSVASQLILLYEWVLGMREQPFFIDIK